MNYRYIHKRAHYLAHLAYYLKDLDFIMEYQAFQGDLRRPVLILDSKRIFISNFLISS